MKKFTLFLFATLFSALSFAALNPYAYGLKSKLSDDEKTVTITYKLNAPATEVSVVVLDGETVLKTESSTGITQGEHSVAISTDGFPKGKTLSWKVEVKGASVASPTKQDTEFSFYLPYGLDCDVDPESDCLGNWYVIEAAKHTATGYMSDEVQRGLYAFNAALEGIKNKNGTYGFTGGVYVGASQYNHSTSASSPTYVNLYRVVTSGGRVFIGRFEPNYAPIVEVNPKDLDADFTEVIPAGRRVVSIDAIGRGENLKLVMLDTDFNLTEYDLGAASSIATPSRTIDKKNIDEKTLSIVRNDATIVYDNDGDIWLNQHRGTASSTCPTIAHISAEYGFDYNNVDGGVTHDKTNNSGIAVSPDGKQLAVVGAGERTLTIYAISKGANGAVSLSKKHTIYHASNIGKNHTALAWDYAGNLYVANRSAEKINFYAMPYSGTVSTPCASKYAFSLKADPQLNPFAYNLTSELSADEKNLTINYSLNAKATSVNWVLMDGNSVVKTIDLASLGLEKGDYTTAISTTDFPQYKQLKWKIEVKGVAVNEPTEYPVNHSLYHPSSVDIDNNPENATFGLLLVNEGMHEVKTKTKHADGSTYVSSGFGAGIFAFNPAFENIGKYNGGITFTNTRADGTGTAYSPRRIRISDDGRIFVTSLNTDGNYLWEVNPENLNEWTPVFKGADINADKELVDASDSFIVGPNTGFDVKGSGSNLKLMMYSVNLRGITAAHADAFKCAEYNLGNEAEWSTKPSKTWIEGKYAITYNGTQVEYDNEGGFWVASYRGAATNTNPGLVHINKDGVATTFVWNNVRNAGIRFNHDYTKLVVAGYNGAAKKATIYTVSKNASGTPVLTEELVIDMAIVGNNLNDFAWDYAGNLYACGNSNEKLAVWAMPRSSEDVVATPAASKYAFSIGKYTVTVNTNDENKGTVSGAGEYLPGATATLTATPKEGYELLYWSDHSKENPRTITVDGNKALSAYFIKKNDVEPTFSITKVWENTNVPASTADGYQAVGWDQKIYMQNKTAGKIITYSSAEDTGTDYATSGSGQQIAVDEAGNLIVFNAYFATSNPANILIYKKGSTTGTEVSFTLQQAGQCHFFSASGDIYSAEGGYVYFYCQNKTAVNRVKIKNGAATAADVTVDVVGDEIFAGNTQNHVMEDIFGNLVAVSRSNAASWINVHTNESSKTFATTLSGIKLSTLGGCTFELAGKEFWAFNVGSTHYNSEWNLYNLTDKKFESSENLYTKNKTDKNSAANWLNVQVVDEKTAYIYQFCPAVGAAIWKVTRDHIVTATAENGTVAGTGMFKDNATATLTATPNKGYKFKNWTKNGVEVSTENPYSFTVTEDVELVANFDGPFHELILNTNDEAKGTVSGAGFYLSGQTATITATPAAGYKLLYWSDRSTENPRTITMNKDEAISAYFVKEYDMEPIINVEKVWENTNVPTVNTNGYQAVGWDGKIYLQASADSKIMVYDGTGAATEYATSGAGYQIAVDEAGNLIVYNGYFATATPNNILIYAKGSTTGKAVTFTLPEAGRCDFFSASGNIYSAEGGYVYFYCNTKNVVNRVKITNGAATAADVTIDVVGKDLVAGCTQNNVIKDIFGNLVAHSRLNGIKALNVITNEASDLFILPNLKTNTLGGCTFELGGKELWAYNVGSKAYNSEWNLYNVTDKESIPEETLYALDKTTVNKNQAANWLNVQVVDEKTAYIYQYCPTVAAAVWKVSIEAPKYTRTLTNGDYGTICLPYASSNYTGAEFYEIAYMELEADGTTPKGIWLDQVASGATLEAGKPYIIKATSDLLTVYYEGDKVLNPVEGKAGLTGTFSDITDENVLKGNYMIANNKIWLCGTGCWLNANRAYIDYDIIHTNTTPISKIPGRRRVCLGSSGENTATGTEGILAPSDEVIKVIENGQVIIIRNGEKYNVQGVRL